MQMNHQTRANILAGVMAAAMTLFCPVGFADDAAPEKFDEEAAVSLANKDNCWKCHHLSKRKIEESPSYQEVAAKYRGKKEAVDKLTKHITLGKDVIKFKDGHEELHKFDQKRPPDQVRNLILYILAQ